MKLIFNSILAGAAIGLGGIAYSCSSSKELGAVLFTVGLFLVLTYDLNLFTGKICYLFQVPVKEWKTYLIIYLGNFIGAATLGLLGRFLNINLEEGAAVFALKYQAPWYQEIILGALCNICIFIAVNGHKNQKEQWIKAVSLFFGVMIFILCGFEHSIANIFYITLYKQWNIASILTLLYLTIGNIVGGVLVSFIQKCRSKLN